MKRSGLRWVVVALESLTGVLGLWGGWSMITGAWDLPMDWLQHTPFTSWVLPGLALLVFVGIGELVAAAALALGLPRARELSIAAGLGLIAWIAVQLLWLRVVHPVMQPAIAIDGVLIAWLAWRLPAGTPERSRAGTPVAGR